MNRKYSGVFLIVAGIVCLAGAAFVGAQGEAGADRSRTEARREPLAARHVRIAFESSDLRDALRVGDSYVISMRIENVSDKKIVIDSAWPDCGCALVDVPNGQLSPGEMLEGKVELRPRKAGPMSRSVLVNYHLNSTGQHYAAIGRFEVDVVDGVDATNAKRNQ